MPTLDMISIEIARSRLESLAEEMAANLRRIVRSPLLSETEDFATGLVDARGRLVASSTKNALHHVPLRQSVQHMLSQLQYELEEDDVIIMNDPYQGGTHLADVTLLRITYVQGELLLLPACRAHLDDIGCAAPGSLFPGAYEIYQEGNRITPIFLYKAGRLRKDIMTKLEKNSRVPAITRSTLEAMAAVTQLGARRIAELSRELGHEHMPAVIDAVLDYSERLTQSALAGWPEGAYKGRAVCAGDFQDSGQIPVAVEVQNRDGALVFDFSGSSPQVRGFVNSTLSNTAALAVSALLPFMEGLVPVNDGLLRRIRVVAPEGSVVGARFPAPVGWSARHVGSEIVEAVTQALAAAMPDRAGATWAAIPHTAISRYDTATRSVYLDEALLAAAGAGGTSECDGWGWPAPLSAFQVPSVEMRERERPVQVVEREFVADSAGAGRYRGSPAVKVSECLRADHYRLLAYTPAGAGSGLAGGQPGAPPAVWVERAGERLEPDAGIFFELCAADRLVRIYAGGPGWGEPQQRSRQAVLDDVADGVVSKEQAGRCYGLTVDQGGAAHG